VAPGAPAPPAPGLPADGQVNSPNARFAVTRIDGFPTTLTLQRAFRPGVPATFRAARGAAASSADVAADRADALTDPEVIQVNLTAADIGTKQLGNLIGAAVEGTNADPLPTRIISLSEGIIAFTIDHLGDFVILEAVTPGPVLSLPSTGVTLNNLGPLLTWSNPAGTKWYQIQVVPFNDDGPGINLIIGEPALVDAAQYQVKEPNFGGADPSYVMLPGMTYFWKVRTATSTATPTDADWTAWGNPQMFTTAAKKSDTITAKSPAEGAAVASVKPTLEWANSDKAVFYYEVQASTDKNFGATAGSPALWWELAHGGVSTPPNSYTVPDKFPLRAGSTYYWRVRPRVQGDGDPVAWSATFSFKTP